MQTILGKVVNVLWQQPDSLVFMARGREYRSEFHINPTDEVMYPVKGDLKLQAPAGWQIEPASVPVDLKKSGDEIVAMFTVKPPAMAGEGVLRAVVTTDGSASMECSPLAKALGNARHSVDSLSRNGV